VDIREKIEKTECLYEGSVIKLELTDVTLPDGRPAKREIVRHPGGVGVVALDDEKNIYLVKQYRVPYDDILLEIPAGKLDKGEEPLSAAKRELSEETGLTTDDIKYIGDFYPTVGFCDEILRMFIATGLKQGNTNPDEDEFVTVVKIPFSEAVDLVVNGKIKDGKTIAAILKAKILLNL